MYYYLELGAKNNLLIPILILVGAPVKALYIIGQNTLVFQAEINITFLKKKLDNKKVMLP